MPLGRVLWRRGNGRLEDGNEKCVGNRVRRGMLCGGMWGEIEERKKGA